MNFVGTIVTTHAFMTMFICVYVEVNLIVVLNVFFMILRWINVNDVYQVDNVFEEISIGQTTFFVCVLRVTRELFANLI